MKTLQDVMERAAENGEDVDLFGIRVRVSNPDPLKVQTGVAIEARGGMVLFIPREERADFDFCDLPTFGRMDEEVCADVFVEAHLQRPSELEVLDGQGTLAKLVDAARIGFDRLRACGVEVMAGASCPEDLITVADLALANLQKDPADLPMVITRDDIGPHLLERIAGYQGQLLFIDRSVVKAIPEVAEAAQGNAAGGRLLVHYFGGEA